MISYEFEKYCENCPDIKPIADVAEVEGFNFEKKVVSTLVYCKYKDRCRKIYERALEEANDRVGRKERAKS